jgi:hypothetical protein
VTTLVGKCDTAGPSPAAVNIRQRGAGWLVRVVSLLALALALAGVVRAAVSVYRAASDSFVAPIILSPDNDIVIQSKLNLSRLIAERETLRARVEEHTAMLDAAGQAVRRLSDLRDASSRALEWSIALTDQQTEVATSALKNLETQRDLLQELIDRQAVFVQQTEGNRAAGLVHQVDVEREQSTMDQARLVALQNERDRFAAEAQLRIASSARRALAHDPAVANLATPEMIAQREQQVRIELEILKYEADRRSKLAQKRADEDAIAKIDELLVEMKARPVFRAIERSQNVAFVPYTQIEGVRAGARVYDCALWGLFMCEPVGTVAEVLPGEVAAQDPWGNPARGQYAILALSSAAAAQSKVLRVREQSPQAKKAATATSSR